jgi:outer membrane protein assembly factor BamA
VRVFGIGGGVDYFDVHTGGTSKRSIEEVFTTDTAPGLGSDVTYLRSRAFAEIDWRESPGYTTSGGLYRLDWSNYGAERDAPYTFTRLDAEVDQFLPIFRASSVIALRAMGSFTDTNAGETVPYYLLPDLGGASALRGFRPWRFRDRNRLLLTGEYRWTAGRFIDMALFLDAGKVAPRAADLDLKDLNTSYGIGLRFHAPGATMLRVEVAERRDAGIGFVITFGPSF